MSATLPDDLRQPLVRHQRPLIFGAVGLVILLGVYWLDAALSNSQFSEVFVSEALPSAVPEITTESPLTTQQQLEIAREQARQLLEEQIQVTQTEADSTDALRAEIASMLDQWVASWTSKDVGSYLSFYAEDFDTPFDISREEWAGFRIRRIEEPRWIRVQLEQVDYVQLEASFAALSVTQLYATPGYADRTRKHIDLTRTEQGWKILREDSVETVRLE